MIHLNQDATSLERPFLTLSPVGPEMGVGGSYWNWDLGFRYCSGCSSKYLDRLLLLPQRPSSLDLLGQPSPLHNLVTPLLSFSPDLFLIHSL